MKQLQTLSFSLLLGALIVLPANAHHNGNVYFDNNLEVELKNATVISYQMVNPHGRLVFTIVDEDGNEIEWTAELPSSNNMRRRGLTADLIKAGDKLSSVVGAPGRTDPTYMRLHRVVFANGDEARFSGADAGVTRAQPDQG